ncbi:MAG: hypothetical protein MI865_09935 [Proteobacteria bacterium]|nr:hypothetical protein [Pseudomonadota bacterium]
MKYDLEVFANHDINLKGIKHDTMLQWDICCMIF